MTTPWPPGVKLDAAIAGPWHSLRAVDRIERRGYTVVSAYQDAAQPNRLANSEIARELANVSVRAYEEDRAGFWNDGLGAGGGDFLRAYEYVLGFRTYKIMLAAIRDGQSKSS